MADKRATITSILICGVKGKTVMAGDNDIEVEINRQIWTQPDGSGEQITTDSERFRNLGAALSRIENEIREYGLKDYGFPSEPAE